MKCSICGYDIPNENGWAHGHNAEPINPGRCCGDCNAIYVIPERIKLACGVRARIESAEAAENEGGEE